MKRTATRIAVCFGLLSAAIVASDAGRADYASAVEALDGGDYKTAFEEWRRLAEAGDARAALALAGMLLTGAGIAPDPAQAAMWYRRAAEKGDPIAQINLGELYAEGRGVPRNPVDAYVWFSLAADQGNRWAAERRDELAGTLGSAALARARSCVKAWPPNAFSTCSR